MHATCAGCGRGFEAQRKTARYCGSNCRVRAHRGTVAPIRAADPPDSTPPAVAEPRSPDPDPEGVDQELVAAARRELVAAGRLDSVLGQQALQLAARMCSAAPETGSAFAALSRELRAVMAEAVSDGEAQDDPVNDIDARRARKAAGA